MPQLLIIGYGNPLRGDDGLGWRAADRLRETVADPQIEVLSVHQLTPELMDPISQAARVIFIDASDAGEPGEIRERRLTPAAPSPGQFTHHFTPETLLAGARELFGSAPEAVLYTVSGAGFELGEDLSPPVRAGMERLVDKIISTLPA